MCPKCGSLTKKAFIHRLLLLAAKKDKLKITQSGVIFSHHFREHPFKKKLPGWLQISKGKSDRPLIAPQWFKGWEPTWIT